MTSAQLVERLRSMLNSDLPLPGSGETALRHQRLMDVGREDLSLARLAEAHWDAVAILAEAGREAKAGAIYGVWASEKPGQELELITREVGVAIEGKKMFCSGAGLVDRALITVKGMKPLLVDVDLRRNADMLQIDGSAWKTAAFAETQTATVIFDGVLVSEEDFVGGPGWYLERAGFWHGACGPAACWAGGAAGLVDFAVRQSRSDPHTVAHLGAMQAVLWGLEAILDHAGREIDANVCDVPRAQMRALSLRYLVEQECTEILRRLGRAYGPHPMVMDGAISRRCQELELYLRQSHAERDLESLGLLVKSWGLLGQS
jgi:alkylation response protein AidB-like acyl-CoA dehydrogenase